MQRGIRYHRGTILGFLSVVLLTGFWQYAASARWVDPFFVSSPLAVWQAFKVLASSGVLRNDLVVSLKELGVGFCAAVVVGIPIGAAMGWNRHVQAVLDPYVMGLYSAPRIALTPIMIIWFGVGFWSKAVIVFLEAVFPVVLSSAAGIRNVNPAFLKVGRSFGAPTLYMFTDIMLPASVPQIATGLRLAVGRALVGMVVAEMYAATAGLGFRLSLAGQFFQSDRVLMGTFIIALMGVVISAAFQVLEKRFELWRVKVGK